MENAAEINADDLLKHWRGRLEAFRISQDQVRYLNDGRVVASGGFGCVRKAMFNPSCHTLVPEARLGEGRPTTNAEVPVAVKELFVPMDIDLERLEKRFIRETYVWSQLKHEHILEFLGFHFSASGGNVKAFFLCPWLENGQSVTYIKRSGLSPAARLQLVLDAAEGLHYLHSRVPPICHGDVKGSNLLVKCDGRGAICDFGLARVLDEEFEQIASKTTQWGTVRWTSPERLASDGPPELSSDIWSWGWLTWEIMTGRIPFHTVTTAAVVIYHIMTTKLPTCEEETAIAELPNLSQLIRSCWQVEPTSRPSISSCISDVKHILKVLGKKRTPETNDAGLQRGTLLDVEAYSSPKYQLPQGDTYRTQPLHLTTLRSPIRKNPDLRQLFPRFTDGDTEPRVDGVALTGNRALNQSALVSRSMGRSPFPPAVDSIHTQEPPVAVPVLQLTVDLPETESMRTSGVDPCSSLPVESSSSQRNTPKSPKLKVKTPLTSGHSQTSLDIPQFFLSRKRPFRDEAVSPASLNEGVSVEKAAIQSLGGEKATTTHPSRDEASNSRHKVIEQLNNAAENLQQSRSLDHLNSPRQQPEDNSEYWTRIDQWMSQAPFPELLERPTKKPRLQEEIPCSGLIEEPHPLSSRPPHPLSSRPPHPLSPEPHLQLTPLTPLVGASFSDSYEDLPTIPYILPPETRLGGIFPPAAHTYEPDTAVKYPPSPPLRRVTETSAEKAESKRQKPQSFSLIGGWGLNPVPLKTHSSREDIKTVPSAAASPRIGEATEFRWPKPQKPHSISLSADDLASAAVCWGVNPVPLKTHPRRFSREDIKVDGSPSLRTWKTVHKGKISPTGQLVAVKIIRSSYGPNKVDPYASILSRLDEWLARWSSLDHTNIAKVLGSVCLDNGLAIVSTWYSGSSVAEMSKNTPLSERMRMLRDAAEGLNYLHTTNPPIVHSNLKPENVLIDEDGTVKLGDIGVTLFLEETSTGSGEVHGKPGDVRWTAPEVLEGGNRSTASDVFAFGCVALVIIQDHMPYSIYETDVSVMNAISRGEMPVGPLQASAIHETWRDCWKKNPVDRPLMEAVRSVLELWSLSKWLL